MARLPDGYWTLIEEAFDKVSVHDGHAVFAKQAHEYPEHVRHLLAAHWCQSEVCNGGFNQFFGNSTGVLAQETVLGFRAIGLGEVAAHVQKGVDRFGNQYPTDRSARLRKLKGGLFSRKIDCSDLDDRFYELLEQAGGFDERANSYAEQCA